MSFPEPYVGLVIRYSYLWKREFDAGREEGTKDRPCAIVMAVIDEDGDKEVLVLPITHSAPTELADAIEIPAATKSRLGLDGERSWIVITEANESPAALHAQVPGFPFRKVHTGHWVQLDDPDGVNRLLDEFLQSIPSVADGPAVAGSVRGR